MSTRYGKFTIDRSFIEDHPDVVLQVMANVIVIKAELLWAEKVMDYVGLSEDFEEVEPGAVTPSYEVQFDSDTFAVTWAKVCN